MKKLSAEGRFESGLDEIGKGKVWAFVPVLGERHEAALGIAVANEPGYHPLPEFWAHGSYDEMSEHADELNAAEGKSVEESMRIICSTMRPVKPAMEPIGSLDRDIDPQDIDPDTDQPYAGYSSPSLDTSFHDGEMSA